VEIRGADFQTFFGADFKKKKFVCMQLLSCWKKKNVEKFKIHFGFTLEYELKFTISDFFFFLPFSN
jgi:hypothetical protein